MAALRTSDGRRIESCTSQIYWILNAILTNTDIEWPLTQMSKTRRTGRYVGNNT